MMRLLMTAGPGGGTGSSPMFSGSVAAHAVEKSTSRAVM